MKASDACTLPRACSPTAADGKGTCPKKFLLLVDDDVETGGKNTWSSLWNTPFDNAKDCLSERKFDYQDTIQHFATGKALNRGSEISELRQGVDRRSTPVVDAIKRVQSLLEEDEGKRVDVAVIAFDGMVDSAQEPNDPAQTVAANVSGQVLSLLATGHGVLVATRPRCHQHLFIFVRKGMTHARWDVGKILLEKLEKNQGECLSLLVDLGPSWDTFNAGIHKKDNDKTIEDRGDRAFRRCVVGCGDISDLSAYWSRQDLLPAGSRQMTLPLSAKVEAKINLLHYRDGEKLRESQQNQTSAWGLAVSSMCSPSTPSSDPRKGSIIFEQGEGTQGGKARLSFKQDNDGPKDTGRMPALGLVVSTGYSGQEAGCLQQLKKMGPPTPQDIEPCAGTRFEKLASEIQAAPPVRFAPKNLPKDTGDDKRFGLRLIPVLLSEAVKEKTNPPCTLLRAELACGN